MDTRFHLGLWLLALFLTQGISVLGQVNSSFTLVEEDHEGLAELFEQGPYNVNQPENLRIAGLISREEADLIKSHIISYGPILAFEELEAIAPNLADRLRGIRSTLEFEEIHEKQRGSILIQANRQFQKPEGYKSGDYIGNPLRKLVRFQFSSRKVETRINLEKDPGERGIDLFKGGLEFKLPRKRLMVGNYQLAWGQGLFLWNQFGQQSARQPNQMVRFGREIRLDNSVREYGLLRGLAFAGRKNGFSTEAFLHFTKLDARLDTSGQFIQGFSQTGYHRSENEISDKNLGSETGLGFKFSWEGNGNQVDVFGFGMRWNHLVKPEIRPDTWNRFQGKSYTVLGGSFIKPLGQGMLAGEVGISNGGLGYTLAFNQSFSKWMDFGIQVHQLSSSLPGFHAKPLAERNFGTRGLMLAQTIYLEHEHKVHLFYNSSAHQTLAYASAHPQLKNSFGFQMEMHHPLNPRLMYTRNQRIGNPLEALNPNPVNRFRIQFELEESTPQRVMIELAEENNALAYMGEYQVRFEKTQWRHVVRVNWFYGEDGSPRFYRRSLDLYRSYTFGQLYGKGQSFSYRLEYKTKASKIGLVLRNTQFYDREEIGSGDGKIDGNNRTQVGIQWFRNL